MLAYLDAGSGAALATVLASGAVGLSAAWGSARRRLKRTTGSSPDTSGHAAAATSDGPGTSSEHGPS